MTHPMAEAACIGHPNPDAWFPDHGDTGAEAKAVCAGCPVREHCLLDALDRHETYGIWAGAGEARRRVLRRAYGTAAWPEVLAAHWRSLIGAGRPGDRGQLEGTTRGVTHGRRVTYARGCRCGACVLAAAEGTAVTAVTGRGRVAA